MIACEQGERRGIGHRDGRADDQVHPELSRRLVGLNHPIDAVTVDERKVPDPA
jgi:hypothetical protein